jgi:hypothetical protein
MLKAPRRSPVSACLTAVEQTQGPKIGTGSPRSLGGTNVKEAKGNMAG